MDVSIYTLVAVSLDRYHVMLHPLKPKLSSKSALIIFTIIWLIAFASSMPSLFFYNVYFIDDYGYQCLPHTYHKQQQQQSSNTTSIASYDTHQVYIVYNIYSQYVIPFIIISCAYFRIAWHLYFSKPVGQTKYQEVIARNKRKVCNEKTKAERELFLSNLSLHSSIRSEKNMTKSLAEERTADVNMILLR